MRMSYVYAVILYWNSSSSLLRESLMAPECSVPLPKNRGTSSSTIIYEGLVQKAPQFSLGSIIMEFHCPKTLGNDIKGPIQSNFCCSLVHSLSPEAEPRQRVLLLYPIMALLVDPNIDSLTYTYDDLRSNWFHLDRLLDRMAPVFSIDNSTPLIKELGSLTILPAELLLNIFENLSIIDLMRFRRCNQYSSYFVNTIPPLRTVLRIAPNTVKGIIALQVSTHITAKQLCQKLYQRECDICGGLAQGIYLLTCLRACFACLHPYGLGYFNDAISEHELHENYGLCSEQVAALPSFRPLLCTFTNGMNKFKTEERHILYDTPPSSLYKHSPCMSPQAAARAIREYKMFEQDPNREAVTAVHDPLHFMLRTHMVVVIAPWPDPTALKAEQAVFCSACLGTESQERLYTRDMYSEHLKDCRVGFGHLDRNNRSARLWLCEDYK